MDDDERFTIEIDGRILPAPGLAISAADVLDLSGADRDGVVIRIDGGRASRFAPEEPAVFPSGASPSFRTFRGGPVHHLRVSGLVWDWGGPAITEAEVRSIGGIGDDVDLHVQGEDVPIRRGSVIDLTTQWPPHIEARDVVPERSAVPVVVNGRQVLLDRPDVTFEDLVGLAFPGTDLANPGSRALTVTYRRGPPDRPEGSLVSREAVRVRQGEVFNVSATNKS